MIDEVAIQQLISRYNEAASAGNLEGAVATYMPDGVWESASHGTLGGRDAIKEGLERITSNLEYVSQINAPAVITVDGDTATARSAVRESGKLAGRDEGIEVFGFYIDSLIRTAEGWLFARRTFQLVWAHRVPTMPFAMP
jgi:uncharacterized protein (TIGR02246 family)